MHKFTSGLVTGGILAACGVAWAMSDTKTRRRLSRDGRKAMRKANQMIGNVAEMF